jgi:mRNA export factor
MYAHQAPVLSVCWNKVSRSAEHPSSSFPNHAPQEGNKVISGGGDNAARLFDIQTGQAQQVAQHDGPVKVVKWLETPQGSILVTGSWDKTVKVARVFTSPLLSSDARPLL